MRVRYTDFVWKRKKWKKITCSSESRESGPKGKTTKSSSGKNLNSLLLLLWRTNGARWVYLTHTTRLQHILLIFCMRRATFSCLTSAECFVRQRKRRFGTKRSKNNKTSNGRKKKNKMLCAFSINFLILLLLLFSLLSSRFPLQTIPQYFLLSFFAFQVKMCHFPSAFFLLCRSDTKHNFVC